MLAAARLGRRDSGGHIPEQSAAAVVRLLSTGLSSLPAPAGLPVVAGTAVGIEDADMRRQRGLQHRGGCHEVTHPLGQHGIRQIVHFGGQGTDRGDDRVELAASHTRPSPNVRPFDSIEHKYGSQPRRGVGRPSTRSTHD